ncbi:hypothetical protein [Pseudonocardia sp.]
MIRLAKAQWHIVEGIYQIAVGKAANDFVLVSETALAEARFGS